MNKPNKEPTLAETAEITKLARCRELGVCNDLSSFKSYSKESGDYTKERHAIYADHTLEDILEKMRKRKCEKTVNDND